MNDNRSKMLSKINSIAKKYEDDEFALADLLDTVKDFDGCNSEFSRISSRIKTDRESAKPIVAIDARFFDTLDVNDRSIFKWFDKALAADSLDLYVVSEKANSSSWVESVREQMHRSFCISNCEKITFTNRMIPFDVFVSPCDSHTYLPEIDSIKSYSKK